MVSDVAISQDDSEGVALAKAMKAAKEIRPDDKKRGAAPAGCRAAGSLLWGPERQGGRARRRGDDGGQGSPKAAVFNQLLTTFLVIAMVWRLTVFWLCSKGYSRRALPVR